MDQNKLENQPEMVHLARMAHRWTGGGRFQRNADPADGGHPSYTSIPAMNTSRQGTSPSSWTCASCLNTSSSHVKTACILVISHFSVFHKYFWAHFFQDWKWLF